MARKLKDRIFSSNPSERVVLALLETKHASLVLLHPVNPERGKLPVDVAPNHRTALPCLPLAILELS